MRALVTGASGFIGRLISEKLMAANHRVRALVRKTSKVGPLKESGIEICYGDLSDFASLKQAGSGIDVIFHSAAHVGDWGTRDEFYQGNVVGTRNVIEALVAAGVPRLVHISSVAVYGRQSGIIKETTARRKIGEPYEDTKTEAEVVALDLANKHRFALTIVRPSLIYGPYDYKFVPRLAENLRKKRMMIIGSGRNIAPLVYGEDVADFAVLAASHPAAIGETFNVSSGEPVSWNEFLVTLAERLNADPPKIHLPASLMYATGAVMETLWKMAGAKKPPMITRFAVRLLAADCRYDISKAEKALGYRPKVFYKEGLLRTLAWMHKAGVPAQ
ncbi:MAG: NAD-dependent epimerase/dehydratase family protein [Acidobacteria bacterium]|nr:NAD-dependent epimerase/dehydratase family protein [Acidobacteriota bacterium]MBI3657290.1 NAD-dependent epimerase/dehydratase family protein [Acidobacteriota bacterium]